MVRGMISKSDLMKWWLILDLTSPEGGSVNVVGNGVPCVTCQWMRWYLYVQSSEVGRGAVMAKLT